MTKTLFVIGIGGTGMRCIESFVHLCAIGMFDDSDIHLLAIDTDRDNGNFRRLRELVNDAYIKIKGEKPTALSKTFFSAKLHYYQFSPDYSVDNTYEKIFNYTDIEYNNTEKADLANLLLNSNTRNFDLNHGYRAQTHLGSMLMYHAILNEVENNSNSDIARFVEQLVTTSASVKPRVFIMGSVFGGTGASSIPIIPKAIMKSAIKLTEATDLQSNTFFGATLLTGYFSFKLPSDEFKKNQKVVASSDKFALNSQAAMMFYEADETVKQTYQKFYLLGTENQLWKPNNESNKTITGGNAQENDSHYIELFCATAAFHFFNLAEENLVQNKNNIETDYLYRTIDDKLRFVDFVDDSYKDAFAHKFGMFVALSFLSNLENYDFFEQARSGSLLKDNIQGYEDITFKQVEALKKYVELFHYKITNEEIKDGWLRQMHRSAEGGDKLLFNSKLFSINSKKEFLNFDFNENIYQKNSDYEKNKFSKGLIGGNIFSVFKKEFKNVDDPDVTNKMEKLIKRIYLTLSYLYKFQVTQSQV